MATPPTRPSIGRPERGSDRELQVRTLFSEIAPRYDLLNHVLSLNVDRRWRRHAVDRLGVDRRLVLDLCAGTLDLSLELAERGGFAGRVVSVDFAHPMLVAGSHKLDGLDRRSVHPVCGDGLRLPFASDTFDGAMVAFGVRNLADLDAGFRELARVLRPGGRLVVLEFTTPPGRLMRTAYHLYFRHVLPRVGRLVSGHRWAYSYLPASVEEFPGPDELARRMGEAGLGRTEWSYLTAGIASIHVATKSG